MGHEIAEAIIENGQLKYVNKKLPGGKIKVRLIYDSVKRTLAKTETIRIVRETSGIYKDIDIEAESSKLRRSWERSVLN